MPASPTSSRLRSTSPSWWPAGAFFVAVGLFQLAYVLTAVRRPSALAVAATLLLNLGVLLVYVASRTVGIGVGPSSHKPHKGSNRSVRSTSASRSPRSR